MKVLFTLVVTLVMIVDVHCRLGTLDKTSNTTISNGTSFVYKFDGNPADWESAKEGCVGWGGQLAMITSQAQNNYLTKELAKRNISSAWIGYNDVLHEGKYVWEPEVELNAFVNWALNYPNGGGDENCVVINSSWNGTWNDEDCETKQHYICQKVVDLTCSELDMTVNFNADFLPGEISSISVLNCTKKKFQVDDGNTLHVAFKDCVGHITQTKDTITQENTVAVVNVVKTKNIERTVVYYYKLQCFFDRQLNVHHGSIVNIEDKKESFKKARMTKFEATMEMFTSETFNRTASSPYQATAFEPIYMQIRGTNDNKFFKFITTYCYATPRNSVHHDRRYMFFDDKCGVDSTFDELNPGTHNRFMFKVDAFTFIKMKKLVYFSCELLVCKEDDVTSECTQFCLEGRKRPRRDVASGLAGERGGIETITVRSDLIHWNDAVMLKDNQDNLDD